MFVEVIEKPPLFGHKATEHDVSPLFVTKI
jgi:hypothetical protein